MNKFLALLFLASSSPAAAICTNNCEPNMDNCAKKATLELTARFPYYNSCPDRMECFNGAERQHLNDYRSSEVYDPASEGRIRSAYSCNCTTDVGESAFAGEHCEHPHSSVCEQGVAVSDYALCTNGGQYLKIVRKGERGMLVVNATKGMREDTVSTEGERHQKRSWRLSMAMKRAANCLGLSNSLRLPLAWALLGVP
jgi:hypothetical protein